MTARAKWHYSSVLLADDGSQHAEAAVQLLCDLPLARDISLTVLRAFPSTQAAETYALETHLQKTCEKLRAAGYTPKPELILGSPAEKIIEYVMENRPELILLGAKGLRATFGILLGGVAQQVVEYACCPVLIVRAPYHGMGHILMVTDGSSFGEDAVEYLAGFPLPKGTIISAMHVMAPPLPPVMPVEPGYIGPVAQPIPLSKETLKLRKEEEKQAKALLTKAVKKLTRPGLKINKILKQGDAASEIIAFAKNESIDLIVTGSRGLSQMRAWLLGSVSRKLVHYSDTSILVVRRPEE